MSRYTQTIKSILMENKQAGEDIHSITDMCAIAKRCLFDEAPMNVITSEYRDRLITGFSLHYFNDEIGLETLSLFKIGLSDKIFNNAEYINSIFAHLDKQILSDYQTKTVDGESHDVITEDGTLANTGTSATAKTGSDTLKRTGTENNAHTGTNNQTEHVDDVLTKSGNEVTTYNTQDQSVTDGQSVSTGGEKYTESSSGSDTSKSNTGTFMLDTPQNNVGNLRSTQGGQPYDATGKGITAAAESKMEYMTSAQLGDGTTIGSTSASVSHDASLSRTQTDEDTTVTGTKTGTETLGYTNRIDDRDVGKTGSQTYNENNLKTNNLQDKTEYGSSSTRTDNLLATTDKETVKDGTTGVEEETKNYNLELIYRSIPLLSKVWDIFDELFMALY